MPRVKDTDAIGRFLDDLWKQAQSMLVTGKRKTEKIAQVAKIKMDIYLIDGKKADLFQKLGEAFYKTSKRKKVSAKKQQYLLTLIRELNEIEAHGKGLRKSLKKSFVAEKVKVVKKRRRVRRRKAKPAAKSAA